MITLADCWMAEKQLAKPRHSLCVALQDALCVWFNVSTLENLTIPSARKILERLEEDFREDWKFGQDEEKWIGEQLANPMWGWDADYFARVTRMSYEEFENSELARKAKGIALLLEWLHKRELAMLRPVAKD